MKATIILSALFAGLVASTRVQLSRDDIDAGVQSEIPRNGARTSIAANFGNLGNPVRANRGSIVSGGGSCRIFRDSGATQLVATLPSNGNEVSFGGLQNLQNGVIVCQ